jgi:hypothetical protein
VRVLDALKEIKNDDPDVAFLPQVFSQPRDTQQHTHSKHRHPLHECHRHLEQFYRDTLDQAEALLTEGHSFRTHF